MDLTQDSDEENSKAKNKTQGKRVNEMDDVEEYFDKPVHSKGQVRISVFTLRKYNEYGSDDEDYLDRGDDNGDENGICDSNDENVSEEVMCRSTSHTAQVLKKVDFQRITLSAAKQSEFNTWSKKLEYHGPTLIAGYGIRLNIKYESRNHGYQACNVINKLIENKKDPQERDGGKDFFNKYEIS
ncbi:hypothetical protein PCANC_02567 [Puccinia coronata f. sp. avenae]|uniref:Uncharacterized protein n=1 Tax=Puccinia coronata f. sp. avenae TaxID=200324 RepID=A0A2N5VYG9_9BASI|nr:hypothetical protein PCANC_02567 [Puccinia coronata f. sp. avenae]